MSETKFTPGPWRLDDPSAGRNHVLSDEYHSIDGGIGYLDYTGSEKGFGLMGYMSPSDARLIAASPDMYAALQCAQNVLTLLQDEVSRLGCRADQVTEKIAAALAKANGTQE